MGSRILEHENVTVTRIAGPVAHAGPDGDRTWYEIDSTWPCWNERLRRDTALAVVKAILLDNDEKLNADEIIEKLFVDLDERGFVAIKLRSDLTDEIRRAWRKILVESGSERVRYIERVAHRLAHGQAIESDYICDAELWQTNIRPLIAQLREERAKGWVGTDAIAALLDATEAAHEVSASPLLEKLQEWKRLKAEQSDRDQDVGALMKLEKELLGLIP